jgi:hypothetical protein
VFIKTLLGCFLNWNMKGDSIEEGDVIIAHAGGIAIDGSKGKINDYLESVVRDIHRKTRVPIIAQGELARYISDLTLVGSIPCQSDSKSYIDTVFVAKIHKQICDQYGWKKPILVSYQPHMWRGMMVSRKIGLDVIVAPTKAVYDTQCSQWWMWTLLINTPRELLVRLLWLFQGKI